MDAATKNQQVGPGGSKRNAIVTGLNAGLKSPLLWAPILGIALVLFGIHLPPVVAACFELIGSTTSGVAVFAVGLVLAAHPIRFSPAVLVGTLGRITVQSAVLFALLHLLHVAVHSRAEALVCCSFPLATVSVLFAARYKAVESEAASMLLCLNARLGNHGTDHPLAEPLIQKEKSDWLLPALLSTTAGAVDVIGFLALGGLFTAHITGNLVILAAHYVTGRFGEIRPILQCRYSCWS